MRPSVTASGCPLVYHTAAGDLRCPVCASLDDRPVRWLHGETPEACAVCQANLWPQFGVQAACFARMWAPLWERAGDYWGIPLFRATRDAARGTRPVSLDLFQQVEGHVKTLGAPGPRAPKGLDPIAWREALLWVVQGACRWQPVTPICEVDSGCTLLEPVVVVATPLRTKIARVLAPEPIRQRLLRDI